ncbi:MAG: hypothetical protein VKJ24_16115, partial [Synechococcales bacterium]|nr:hypothetical protein [Synechococcales bacterium]
GYIPQTAGVVIQMPMNLVIDVGQKQEVPYTVPLAQPLYDLQGNEVVPAQTPVSIKLKPENGGAKIVAEAIVVRGQMVPIQAMTAVVPGRTVTEQTGAQRARENSAVVGNLFGAIGGAAAPLSKRADAFEHAGMIGGAVGILSGLSSPRNYRIVEFAGGQVYVLQLQAPITLPSLAMAPQGSGVQGNATPQPAAPQSAAEQPQFKFRNVTQYSEGIEGVIKAFKAEQISLSEARKIVTAADQYATQTLTPKLFPPAGIRRQVQQLFDYTYEIDRK